MESTHTRQCIFSHTFPTGNATPKKQKKKTMASSSEPELSFEQQEVRKVSAKIEAIEGIAIVESEQKDLNPTQKRIKVVVDLNGGLSKYLEELKVEKNKLFDLLKSSTEVYLLLFICNLSERVQPFFVLVTVQPFGLLLKKEPTGGGIGKVIGQSEPPLPAR